MNIVEVIKYGELGSQIFLYIICYLFSNDIKIFS